MSRNVLRLAVTAVTIAALVAPSGSHAANPDGKGGSGAEGGGVAADTYKTKVKKFKYTAKSKRWTGTVKSAFVLPDDAAQGDPKACVEDRHVTLYKKTKKGTAEVGNDQTDAKGKFSIRKKKKKKGKYFVRVDELAFVYRDYGGVDVNGVCAKAKKKL